MSLAGRRRLTVPGLLLVVGLLSCACSTTSTRGSPGVRLSLEFTNGGECAPFATPDLPRDAGCVTTVRGDVDGDDDRDSLTVYARTDEDQLPRSWRMRVQSGGRVTDQSLDAGTEFSYPRAVGAADVNGDERDEWFVKTLDLSGHGTAWLQLSLFTLQSGRISIVEYEDQPLSLRVGGVSRTGEGVGCADGRLVLLRAEADNVATLAGTPRLERSRSKGAERVSWTDPVTRWRSRTTTTRHSMPSTASNAQDCATRPSPSVFPGPRKRRRCLSPSHPNPTRLGEPPAPVGSRTP